MKHPSLSLFLNTRERTEKICAPLQVEDYIPQVAVFASPPKWHLAHTTWFFEEMILKKHLPNYKEFDPEFGFLFNSYYNTIGERTYRANRGNITRPGVSQIYAYRKYVDEKMTELLMANSSPEWLDLLILGINHEQQHQELLITDLKYALADNPTFPVYSVKGSLVGDCNSEMGFSEVPEGIYAIGHSGKGFHFDNERGEHKVYIHNFSISNGLVSNEEFLEFMEDGGYTNFNFWLDEGWSWVNENEIHSPLYWHKINGNWFYFTLEGMVPVDPKAILTHISFYEAQAYANWKGMRLPTEFEWEVASDKLKWGQRWEWTYSSYLPYPNFKIADGAVGEYNGKFMINQMVLRGASNATAENHSRKTYRNFFHPQYRWQYTGIRLVKR